MTAIGLLVVVWLVMLGYTYVVVRYTSVVDRGWGHRRDLQRGAMIVFPIATIAFVVCARSSQSRERRNHLGAGLVSRWALPNERA